MLSLDSDDLYSFPYKSNSNIRDCPDSQINHIPIHLPKHQNYNGNMIEVRVFWSVNFMMSFLLYDSEISLKYLLQNPSNDYQDQGDEQDSFESYVW